MNDHLHSKPNMCGKSPYCTHQGLCKTQIAKTKKFKKLKSNLQAMDLEIKLGMYNIKLWL
jgi:hypothetical protein